MPKSIPATMVSLPSTTSDSSVSSDPAMVSTVESLTGSEVVAVVPTAF